MLDICKFTDGRYPRPVVRKAETLIGSAVRYVRHLRSRA